MLFDLITFLNLNDVSLYWHSCFWGYMSLRDDSVVFDSEAFVTFPVWTNPSTSLIDSMSY